MREPADVAVVGTGAVGLAVAVGDGSQVARPVVSGAGFPVGWGGISTPRPTNGSTSASYCLGVRFVRFRM
ncbi:hypothetical protein C5746_22185 [Streptomyces atratus]|uniref:Uncharacterized protein n=1 Tax=Streptomyces atratus TaxID=1893 RepID=A0A2Z5JFN9_STRAR|nr:hypothetical protein C5746_22185 [Streptomyces atratus]